jgi:arsenical pump membrane protein
MSSPILVWSIAAGAIAGILFRPRGWPEAVWASLGAILLVAAGLLPVAQAGQAIAKGTDVYLFLTGMMLLAELARQQGLFDWLATHAVAAAKGSRVRLFTLVYLVGIAVTVLLSNDATAVVLTPAVYAAVKRARTEALPYLLICAFIANAASFVLPISNPANLVVYGKTLPPLLPWLGTFLAPSVVSMAATYLILRWTCRAELRGPVKDSAAAAPLSRGGRASAWGIAGTGTVLLLASGLGLDLGLPTLLAAILAVLLATRADRHRLVEAVRGVSWSVLPLVAGLFVLVEGIERAGALGYAGRLLDRCAALPPVQGALAAAFGVGGLSNVMNNLPSGLLAGAALQAGQVPNLIRDAVLVGVDLGPNLSVTGSLATVLWLIALRREGVAISAWQFLRFGILVMPPALLGATLGLAILRH